MSNFPATLNSIALAAILEIDNTELTFRQQLNIAEKLRIFAKHAEPMRVRIAALELAVSGIETEEPAAEPYAHLFVKVSDDQGMAAAVDEKARIDAERHKTGRTAYEI